MPVRTRGVGAGARSTGLTCLHCVLARALRAEGEALERRGVTAALGYSDPVQLPISGVRTYRRLRRLLAEAGAKAETRVMKLAVIALDSKSYVEVTAMVVTGGRARVLRCEFPRQVPGTLGGGFLEGLGIG